MDDKIIKRLLNKYTNIIERLRGAGVIRTGKVVADYGEYIVSKKLNLTLADSSINKGYDAVDTKRRKYEIKTRKATAWNKPTISPVNSCQVSIADFLIYIEFDNKWNITKLLKIPVKKLTINKYKRIQISRDLVKKFSIL